MKEKVESIRESLNTDIKEVKTTQDIVEIKSKYIGKTGLISELTKGMAELSIEEKKEFGMIINELKNEANSLIFGKEEEINNALLNEKLNKEAIDITLPSKKIKRGSLNPMTRITEEFEDLFVSMGYTVFEGPELETDENCFRKLNLPIGHPARDAQDTFYLKDEVDEYLLRSQTSTAQVRAMEANEDKGPIRIVCPGKVYRRDEDATHSHQFMQIEGLVIDKNISMADLKGTLETMMKHVLGEKTEVRFRPSYFPFTEPSVEVDVTCFKCSGKGCNLCKDTGWIEVLGAGMVHPDVLTMSGYDPKVYQGFAFGTGLDRMAMFKYGIPDIRTIYGNDLRFINQFDRKDEE
ncbi:MAG: phenylalanine--tRNA ligase subunit alpha [Bacilli bacterium]|nr:phenylalanine--tRNA ligase subunit alpha [Bacilli bacterium]